MSLARSGMISRADCISIACAGAKAIDDAGCDRVYRQIMYWVVLRAIASAIGGWVGSWRVWERTGRVAV
jgi:hypothetical protein